MYKPNKLLIVTKDVITAVSVERLSGLSHEDAVAHIHARIDKFTKKETAEDVHSLIVSIVSPLKLKKKRSTAKAEVEPTVAITDESILEDLDTLAHVSV